ncbi:DUF952 domain-containing protein [Sphingomonas sp.]|jgi:uncharacterized protein (DUF952 family)|uniref:DUF952 domain-containing protein n=1 Tax=Sphingomonas sp. TaxID=28214 RepID=UPI002D7ECDEC|nr:DUF952 domain-containing protein [Sphingomonas sp.]HEU0044970.1 DUF952 domain-containing protein [Sphingomonas sp.]
MRDNAAFKVLTTDEKDALERDGRFAGSNDDRRDGYIHLSTADQLTATVDKHFAGATDLWVAEVDLDAVGEAVRWEASRGGEDFPHLYRDLPLDAVVAYSPLERDEAGTVRLPVTG